MVDLEHRSRDPVERYDVKGQMAKQIRIWYASDSTLKELTILRSIKI